MTLSYLGDTAVVLNFGEAIDESVAERVRCVAAALRDRPLEGIVDLVPAFTTLTAFYDPGTVGDVAPFSERLLRRVEAALAETGSAAAERLVEMPVCYEREHAPDLAEVAERCGLTVEDVVARHSGAEYRVRAIGFAPGFPYLSGLPPELRTPRRATPRTWVPAGAVGIGGAQTGIYSVDTPGGWQLIGRTPLVLFDAVREEPAWLRVGDRVRFRAISQEEFNAWK